MKIVKILLLSSLAYCSVLIAETAYERQVRQKNAYKNVVVVDWMSCKKRVKLKYIWAWNNAQSNNSSNSYYDTLNQYKKLEYDECRRKWK